jgi:hypothetical protein
MAPRTRAATPVVLTTTASTQSMDWLASSDARWLSPRVPPHGWSGECGVVERDSREVGPDIQFAVYRGRRTNCSDLTIWHRWPGARRARSAAPRLHFLSRREREPAGCVRDRAERGFQAGTDPHPPSGHLLPRAAGRQHSRAQWQSCCFVSCQRESHRPVARFKECEPPTQARLPRRY